MDNSLRAVSEVLATTPHVMFCVKDLDGVYLASNRTFAERAGGTSPGDVIGRTAHALFPRELADSYAAQDAEILRTGKQLSNELEFITRPDASIGWYLTSKSRVCDDDGAPTGIVSISVDLRTPADAAAPHAALARAVEFARENIGRTTTVAEMADVADMSTRQLERSMSRVLGLSPKQLVLRLRLEAALHQLEASDDSIIDIALRCGYYDQSDFTRHFTRVVGMSPGAFRRSPDPFGA
ncbi:AraC family transcriptional regulator [Ilumatobacter nonamiensis]|uniref:AraC family transcriptional regulator n=1 Tax=Ilumatobacter nonamiensis TaxID=467093 RepID=UPI00130E9AA9|nr:helix-turn-helix domain-containing protein [Ilumatobacter nonamiensis]